MYGSLRSRVGFGSSERSIKSTVVKPQEIEETDESRLSRAVSDAGRYADGIAAVEVWMLDELHLVQPDGGWWRDPNFEANDEEALDRIEDKERDDYVAPPPQLPGTGLAGGLWTVVESDNLAETTRHFLFGDRNHNTAEEKANHRRASMMSFRKPTSVGGRRSSLFSREQVPMVSMRDVMKAPMVSMEELSHHSDGSGVSKPSLKTQDHPETPEDPNEAAAMKISKEDDSLDSIRASPAPARRLAPSNKNRPSKNRPSMMRRASLMFGRTLDESQHGESQHGESPHRDTEMFWRDIHSLTVDPDQPTFLRLKLLEDAGFAKATGVRFEFRGQKGIVLYLAKSDTDIERLSSSENCAYMRSAADLVGAAVSLIKHKTAILALKASAVLDEHTTAIDDEQKEDGEIVRKIKVWAHKLKGGDLQPPPPMPSKEAALTFIGSFLTLLILSKASEGIKGASDNKYFIVLGPFGALVSTSYKP
jgi:hypothetical protein